MSTASRVPRGAGEAPLAGSPAVAHDLSGCRYAVVGGGMSGLAAAWYLQRRGAETHIIERDGTLGGRAGSGQLGDRVVTLGGKNIGRSYTRFREFVASLGEHPFEYFGINSSRVVDGKVLTFDSEHRARTVRNLRGIPGRDVARLVRLAAMVKRDPEVRCLSEESCDRLARRYRGKSVEDAFGPRLRELLMRSLTVRVSAAEPGEVPMANVLPYVGMITDTYDQLTGGMHEVVAAAARSSSVRVGAEVRRLLVDRGRVCGVEICTPGGERVREDFDGVVLAAHAHAAGRLLEPVAQSLGAMLGEVRYFPVVVLLAEYERPVFDPKVRAVVFGSESELSNAGAYGMDDLNVVRYTFSGRRARPLADREPDPELLAELAERTLAPFASVRDNRHRALSARRLSPGLCAYHQDQARFLERVGGAVAGLPGLALTGDYLRGCSIEACFAAAEQAVAAIEPSSDRPAQGIESPARAQPVGVDGEASAVH